MILDFVGNQITPGCTVVYPVRRGSSMWLNRLVVTAARSEGLTGHNPEGRTIHVKNVKNVVVVNLPQPSLAKAA
jgi:hypothetical protein